MDIDDNQTQQPISDDQDLAKALAGINDNDGANVDDGENGPLIPPLQPLGPQPEVGEPPVQPAGETEVPAGAGPADFALGSTNDLDGVKKVALDELRPLVGKLNLSPEEKFDVYLLLLRSTDDRELVAPAHETATQIADETRRAQALLDIIKEIDYLNNPTQQ